MRGIVTAAIFIATAFVSLSFLLKVKNEREMTAVIDRTHFLTKALEVYVADNGSFPETLESLASSRGLDKKLIVPAVGEQIAYRRPSQNDLGTTAVLIVRLKKHTIVVDKNFQRTGPR
jgi:hypothetical protein